MASAADAGLGLLGRWARRQARRGQPVWYLVIGCLWLVDRARRDRGAVLWRGTVRAAEVLTVAVRDGAAHGAGEQPPAPRSV